MSYRTIGPLVLFATAKMGNFCEGYLKGTATFMLSCFKRTSSIIHGFRYQFHKNWLKNGKVVVV